jgi:UDP-perosamine 4-acetyltransferase
MDYLYCSGEHARVVLDILERSGHDRTVALLDDDDEKWGQTLAGHEIVGGESILETADPESDRALVAYGAGQGVRLELIGRIRSHDLELFSALDPTATLSTDATIGRGVMVNAESYLGPGTTVEDGVLVDSMVNVSHDTDIQQGATVCPGVTLGGGVTVGEDAYIGAGATVIDHITVGEGAVVGAGAVVVDDVSAVETVIGVPAEPLE